MQACITFSQGKLIVTLVNVNFVNEGTRGVMDMATQVQILDETDCISHSTNTLGKGMNPIILPPAMGKIVGQTRFFSLGEATSLGEGKLWIQTC